ncbi:hypothetical protein NBRC116583_33990 [Arenicella sp. 4NH20-0111]|uniref:hypothetical protein n=1 Tax=Arenicella sp. 4NH20-0111 TaxID=3127648 RepID=UPI00310A23A9
MAKQSNRTSTVKNTSSNPIYSSTVWVNMAELIMRENIHGAMSVQARLLQKKGVQQVLLDWLRRERMADWDLLTL